VRFSITWILVFFCHYVSLGRGDFGADIKDSKYYRLDSLFPVLLAKNFVRVCIEYADNDF
jgi:hypothetical protein